MEFEKEKTALLLVDPYNDFISEDEFMHAALVTNLPNYANAIVTTNELVETIQPVSAATTAKAQPAAQE